MKPRRDITLGEMQDECSFRGHNCETIGGEPCKHYAICNQIRTKSCTPPEDWDLSDPPRFNEAQMALLKALKSIGVERIMSMDGAAFRMLDSNEKHVSLMRAIGLTESETLDLAELLGKDGADEKA